MEKINNLNEAEDFFMRNHSDGVICVKGDIQKEVSCYPEAKEFFNEQKEESPENQEIDERNTREADLARIQAIEENEEVI